MTVLAFLYMTRCGVCDVATISGVQALPLASQQKIRFNSVDNGGQSLKGMHSSFARKSPSK